MGSGGAGKETSNAEGDTMASTLEVFEMGGDFKAPLFELELSEAI